MSGDKFNLQVNSWWSSVNTPGSPASPLSELAAALAIKDEPVSGILNSIAVSSNNNVNTAGNLFYHDTGGTAANIGKMKSR